MWLLFANVFNMSIKIYSSHQQLWNCEKLTRTSPHERTLHQYSKTNKILELKVKKKRNMYKSKKFCIYNSIVNNVLISNKGFLKDILFPLRSAIPNVSLRNYNSLTIWFHYHKNGFNPTKLRWIQINAYWKSFDATKYCVRKPSIAFSIILQFTYDATFSHLEFVQNYP